MASSCSPPRGQTVVLGMAAPELYDPCGAGEQIRIIVQSPRHEVSPDVCDERPDYALVRVKPDPSMLTRCIGVVSPGRPCVAVEPELISGMLIGQACARVERRGWKTECRFGESGVSPKSHRTNRCR